MARTKKTNRKKSNGRAPRGELLRKRKIRDLIQPIKNEQIIQIAFESYDIQDFLNKLYQSDASSSFLVAVLVIIIFALIGVIITQSLIGSK